MSAATLAGFKAELQRRVPAFLRDKENLDEANARQRFINPFFAALGWELENADQPLHAAEVVVEWQADTAGRQKKVDYLFRIGGMDKFVCEAKRPSEDLSNPKCRFQAQNYTYRRSVYLGLLTNFDCLHVYVVGAQPDRDRPLEPVRVYQCSEYESRAAELWELLARDNVANGSLDRFIAGLPKLAAGKNRQGWMPKPGRTRAVDDDFLDFLDKARASFAKRLVDSNPRFPWGDTGLNEAVQRILDRILFVRVCEDRDIDTFRPLHRLIEDWQAGGNQPGELWASLLELFRRIGPQFNGGLFGKPGEPPHFSDSLKLDDAHLAGFIEELSREDSTYNFNDIRVEIIGSVYERFLTKVIHVTEGGAVAVKLKPEVRKSLGAVYTPRYIVNYIVEQTVGKLLAGKSPRQVADLKIIDIACGSGAFLLRTFERICEHYVEWYSAHPKEQSSRVCYRDDQKRLRLTAGLKRQIMLQNIYGVDIDPQAVEVSQLSLYLKILEGETRHSLNAQRELFPQETLLPDLSRNIVCGNSLIGHDITQGQLFASEEEKKLNPMDFEDAFSHILGRESAASVVREDQEPYAIARTFTREGGRRFYPSPPAETRGFDAIIGNPPYGAELTPLSQDYLRAKFKCATKDLDTYALFMEQAVRLTKPGGRISMIVPTGWYSGAKFPTLRRFIACETDPESFVNLPYDVFKAWVDTTIFVVTKRDQPTVWPRAEEHPVSIRTFPKRHRISNEAEFYDNLTTADFAKWFADGKDEYLTYADAQTTLLMRKIQEGGKPLKELADVQRGVTPFKLTERPTHKTSQPAFDGTVRRYLFERGRKCFIRYDQTLAEFKPERYFKGPRLLLRELISRQFRLQATKVTDDFVTNKSMQSILHTSGGPDLNYLLGVLNSGLMSWYFLRRSNIAQRDDFPKIVLKETRELPIAHPDKAKHDAIVRLVERMLAAKKQLAKARADADRQYHERRCAKLDQQIDELVYKLYGLTDEERTLVETRAG